MNPEAGIPIEQFHSIVTFIWGLVCLLMGITLMAFHMPESETVKTYRISVRILSVNYLILSLFVFCLVFLDLRNCPDDVFPFTILLISTSQELILAYVLISLYVPRNFVRKNFLYYNIIPLSILIILYGMCVLLFGDPVCDSIPHFFSLLLRPTVLIRFLLLLFNIYQIVFYSVLLQKLSARYTRCLERYYSDTIHLKPQWVKKTFCFAVFAGISSMIPHLFKDYVPDIIFMVVFSIYYFLFAIMYMQYKNIFTKLEPEFIKDLALVNPVENEDKTQKKTYGFSWSNSKSQILDRQLYLQPGITVNDMSVLFHTNRTTFSTQLNKNEGLTFNQFINTLRIERAKQLLIENPHLTLADVAQQCGYTEQSNFTRQFRQLCNETPAVWLKAQKKTPEE